MQFSYTLCALLSSRGCSLLYRVHTLHSNRAVDKGNDEKFKDEKFPLLEVTVFLFHNKHKHIKHKHIE